MTWAIIGVIVTIVCTILWLVIRARYARMSNARRKALSDSIINRIHGDKPQPPKPPQPDRKRWRLFKRRKGDSQ